LGAIGWNVGILLGARLTNMSEIVNGEAHNFRAARLTGCWLGELLEDPTTYGPMAT